MEEDSIHASVAGERRVAAASQHACWACKRQQAGAWQQGKRTWADGSGTGAGLPTGSGAGTGTGTGAGLGLLAGAGTAAGTHWWYHCRSSEPSLL
jgi:hypothetical protein